MWLTLFACAARSAAPPLPPPPEGPDGHLKAALINGGHEPEANFSSHLAHLQETRAVLLARGFRPADIAVFDSDGGDPAPDQHYATPENPDDVLLFGTSFQRLADVVPLRDSAWDVPRAPSRKRAIEDWFARTPLTPGDVLLLYTTDHGNEDGIALWREEWSVGELGGLLTRVPDGVRVVLAMNQCHAATFADALQPARDQCGLFAVPADRLASGCYPMEPDERIGHAFALVDALQTAPDLASAHARVNLLDDSPDIPMLSSDVQLARALAGADLDALLAERGITDLRVRRPELAAFHALADRFQLAPVENTAALARDAVQEAQARDDAEEAYEAWLGVLAAANRQVAARAFGRDRSAREADAVRVALATQAGAHRAQIDHIDAMLDRTLETFEAHAAREAARQRQLVALRRVVGSDSPELEAARACEREPLGAPPSGAEPPLPPLRRTPSPIVRPAASEVAPGSAAWEAGVRPTDELVQVGDETDPAWFDIAMKLGARSFVVRRGGEQRVFTRD